MASNTKTHALHGFLANGAFIRTLGAYGGISACTAARPMPPRPVV